MKEEDKVGQPVRGGKEKKEPKGGKGKGKISVRISMKP